MSLDQFAPNPNAPDGRRSTCSNCVDRRRSATEKPCDRCGEIKPLFQFPRSNGSFDGHRHTCTDCLERERAEHRQARAQQQQAEHQLGGCLTTLLREVGPRLMAENATRPGKHAAIGEVIDVFTRTAPHKLHLRADLEYSPTYLECLRDDSLFPIGERVATIYLVDGRGRQPAYHFYAPAPDEVPGDVARTMPAFPRTEPAHPALHSATPEDCRAWASALLHNPDEWVLLSMEMTGLWAEHSDIIEIAAVDLAGKVLVNTLVRPRHPVPSLIQRKTGIRPRSVERAPDFAAVYANLLAPLLTRRKALFYNADRDLPMLQHVIWRACTVAWQPVGYASLQRTYQVYRSGPALLTLERACREQRILQTQTHRALDEGIACLALLRAMAG